MSGVAIFYPNALTTPSFVLTQFKEANPQWNWEESSVTASGAVFPGFTGMESHEPKLETSTTEIKKILDAMQSDGVAVGFDGNVDLEWQRGRNLGTREQPNQSQHINLRSTRSLFFWKSIKAGEKGFAEIDFCFKPIIDEAGNPPLVPSFGSTLTQSALVQELYRTGPVVMTVAPADGSANQTFNVCNDGWTWENNVVLKRKSCAGATADVYAAVETVTPKLTIPTENTADVLRFTRGGAVVSIDCYLRRAAQGGLNLPNDVAQHIKMSSVSGTVKTNDSKTIGAMVHSFSFDTSSVIPGPL